MICYRRMSRIPWTAYKINKSTLEDLRIEPKQRLLRSIQRRMLKFLGNVIKRNDMEILTVQVKVDGKKSRPICPL